ncbi:cytochrome c3 family protein [Ruegeria arenilitoris]|uniref:cytochrome c3 family protein n=1 Tax=Ruegeria arenilitoris TaxID=1173585 RepID=UPI00148106E2|nr:cytochrome c3 family protein [Ruegeria arenilitoris]MBY6082761.1 hypothetical protein [Ruegeria arenilitoris]
MKFWRKISKFNSVRSPMAAVMFAVVSILSVGVWLDGTQAQSLRNLPEAKHTDGGPEACLTCHGGPEMTLMAETPHGDADNPHAPYGQQGCESCHGPGSFHVSSARGGVGFPPLNDFSYAGRPKEGQFDTCLGCHANTSGGRLGIGWLGSSHDVSGMTCSTCHEVHATENPLAELAGQRALCASCHGLTNSKHEDFENNGIQIETLQCATCHDPHDL